MDIVTGDYAVLAADKKKFLIKVTHEPDGNGSTHRGTVVDASAAKPATRQQYNFEPADILANLGPAPKWGTVHGIKIEPFRRMINHPMWGDIFLFRSLEQIEQKMMLHHMTTVGQKLKQLGVFPARKETQVHVRPAGGKYPGMYTHNSKENDTITLKLATFDAENMDYYLSHEWGHGMWFTMMPPQFRAQWIKYYMRNTQKLMTGSQRLAILMKDYIDSGLTIMDFRRGLDDNDKLVLGEILAAIRKVHSMDPRHIDELRLASVESIQVIWPKTAIELPQHQILVSDYANKNPDEFWCEAFSFWFIGKQIPAGLKAAVEKTVAACKLSGGFTASDAIAA